MSPQGWNTLRVRASWWPRDRATSLDLEVQIQAFTVDELRAVEIILSEGGHRRRRAIFRSFILTTWHDPPRGMVGVGFSATIWKKASSFEAGSEGSGSTRRLAPTEVDRLVTAFVNEPLPLGT